MRVLWSEPAVEQLETIRELPLRAGVFRAAFGLVQFPEKGRRPPELDRFPELDKPFELRELVFPGLCRLFYRLDRGRDTIRIVGMTFRGQNVSPDMLAAMLSPSLK